MWLQRLLEKRLFKKKHEVMKLKWKQAELTSLLQQKDKLSSAEFQERYKQIMGE